MTPVRTCIGCRRPESQDLLLRLVNMDGRIVDGTLPRLPGRGAYLHRRRHCVELARRRGAMARALGSDKLDAQLEQCP